MRAGDTALFPMDRILLNCDLGENEPYALTDALLGQIDAANICCGVHAGSKAKTCKTIERALEKSVMIGAHPGMAADQGRGTVTPRPLEFETLLDEQISSFRQMAADCGARMDYIKLHGMLYHAVESDESLAKVFLSYLQSLQERAGIFARAGGRMAAMAQEINLPVWEEAFADRGYRSDGSLLPRTEAGALLAPDAALQRLIDWQESGLMQANDGTRFHLKADTLCLHADTPEAERVLGALKAAL